MGPTQQPGGQPNMLDVLSQMFGGNPPQAPQGTPGAHMQGMLGQKPESDEEALKRLQMEQRAPMGQPPVDQNMLQRALGSLLGGR